MANALVGASVFMGVLIEQRAGSSPLRERGVSSLPGDERPEMGCSRIQKVIELRMRVHGGRQISPGAGGNAARWDCVGRIDKRSGQWILPVRSYLEIIGHLLGDRL